MTCRTNKAAPATRCLPTAWWYLPTVDGEVHLKLRYFATTCADRLAAYQTDPELLDDAAAAWWGDYVR